MTTEMTDKIETAERIRKTEGFDENFHELTQKLAGAYSIPDEIYGQEASIARFEAGESINQAERFLKFAKYDPNKAEEILKGTAILDNSIKIGEILSVDPDSEARGRSKTIAVLAQRAARLEALLDTKSGIPEIYAMAQGQTRKALNLIEKAASLANDWNTNWGTLNTDNALVEAGRPITRKKIAQAGMVGVLALAGCAFPVTQIPSYTETATTPTVTEVVPAMTETVFPTPTMTATPVPTETESLSPIPTETITQTEPGENISGVLFPESLEIENDDISLRTSIGAKNYFEEYLGININEVVVDPSALQNLRNNWISTIKDYFSVEQIKWNGYVPFSKIPQEEIQITNNVLTFNPDNIKHILWDTDSKLNIYTVTKDELDQIYNDLTSNHPDLKITYTYSWGSKILIYSDYEGSGETFIFSTGIQRVKPENVESVNRFDLVAAFSIWDFNNLLLIRISETGKRGGETLKSDWLYESFGCVIGDKKQPCKLIDIR